MITLNVKSDVARVSRELGIFGRTVEKATASALNKAVAQGKTKMAQEIYAEYNLKSARIKERLAIRRAYAAGTIRLSAELRGTGKRAMNVIPFLVGQVSTQQRKARAGQQLGFRIRKGGSVKQIAGAFIGNAGRTVFRRTGKARLPIESVRTIDVPQMFNQKRINQIVRDVMRNDFARIYASEARYFASRIR